MDPSAPSYPTIPEPFVYKPRSSRVILIAVFVVTIILSFLAGYLFFKFSNPKNQLSAAPVNPTSSAPVIPPNLTVNLPIETTSSAVKSLYIVYLLTGRIDNITPIAKNGKSGYEIQILSPTGPLVNQKFFVTDRATNVVRLDKQSKETKYQLSMLKKDDPIQISFQLNIKKDSETQVTKIAVLK